MRALLPEIEQRCASDSERIGHPGTPDLSHCHAARIAQRPSGTACLSWALQPGLRRPGARRSGERRRGKVIWRGFPSQFCLRASAGLRWSSKRSRRSRSPSAPYSARARTGWNAGSQIPALSGVSKESISMGFGYLVKRGFVQVLSQEHARRGRIVLLTSAGTQLQMEYQQRLRKLKEALEGAHGPGGDIRPSHRP